MPLETEAQGHGEWDRTTTWDVMDVVWSVEIGEAI